MEFRIYDVAYDGVSEDGGVIQKSLGCSGTMHAEHVDEVFYEGPTKVVHANHLVIVMRGPCDGRCKPPKDGSFIT